MLFASSLFLLFPSSRSTLNFTCAGDSSPQTYTVSSILRASWVSSVDFPIPGSPIIRITSPGTIPPPSTRSNSPIPLDVRFISPALISLNFCSLPTTPGLLPPAPESELALLLPTITLSTKVFHLEHSWHCPCHLGCCPPQLLHSNITLFLAIVFLFNSH